MKILQILPELNVGGVETGTVDFAKYLIQHNHQAIVVSNGGVLVSKLESMGVKHYRLPVHKKSLWTMISSIKKLRKIIEEEKVQIVHARSRVPAWIAFFACRKTKAAFITTCHGYYKNRWFSQIMGWPKLIIVPSEAIGRHMIEDYGVMRDNIRRIARSVDLDKFKTQKGPIVKKDSYVIAIVGRITPLKGHRYFLEAMAKVIRRKQNIKIWIIGNPPADKPVYKEELEVLSSRLGIRDHVEFLGSRSDIPQLLPKVDVLVMSSIEPESFGRVILEAQAAGVPAVATSVGGVVDIIDHDKTGLLVMPKDAEGIAEAVLKILDNPDLANQFVAKARQKIEERFTLEHMASQTITVYEELLKLESILVIKLSALGDVILITASLKALRQKFPDAKIYCLVERPFVRVLQNCPYIDGIFVYDDEGRDKGLLGVWQLASNLRKFKFDKVIDFQNNRLSHLISFFLFPKDSFGYAGKWGWLLTHALKTRKNKLPPVEHQFQILNLLGISYTPQQELELCVSEGDKEYINGLFETEWLANSKDIVGINLSASEKWETKNWPIKYMAELCDLLAKKNVRVVLTGTEKDRPKVRELLSLTKSKPSSFVGKTDILQLAALIGRCKVFITPDSAPMHVAAAMKTSFIAFFGPTDSTRHLPPAAHFVVMDKKLSCSPCYSTKCKISTHACMKDITVADVMKQVEKLLKEQR
jgi:lipopolysaccharide heptosyltransferase II